jgi:ribosomal protein L12E/L44/L45/RPP1/RPP2
MCVKIWTLCALLGSAAATCSTPEDEVSLVQVQKILTSGSDRTEKAAPEARKELSQEAIAAEMMEEEDELEKTTKHQEELLKKVMDKVGLSNKIEMMRTKLEIQDKLLKEVLKAVSEKGDPAPAPAPAPAKDDKGTEDPAHDKELAAFDHWHAMDPFKAAITRDSEMYKNQIDMERSANRESNQAWKRYYVDQVQDDATAWKETMVARHQAYRQHLNGVYNAVYDSDPFRSENEVWQDVGHED